MRSILTFALTVAISLVAAPAFADRIDGNWCNPAGGNLHIEGDTIRIPSGRTLLGEYGHHSFRYVAPHGENDEGAEITMIQRSEEEMTLFRGSNPDGETWRRCSATS
ncbi:MAG: hypothetical protein WBO55_14890 [Rhizobiaceae bacterium]